MIMPGMTFGEDPCITCTKISEKFVEGYKKTAGSGFGGGNTDWEEKKLKGYAKSETRLIEILESSCGSTEAFCNSFLEEYEDQIEQWYQEASPKEIDNFYQWLCIDTAKVCCPKGTFGKNCRKCHYGDNKQICSGNGVCDGEGIRSGNGRCYCNKEYSGTYCSNCKSGYIKSINEDNNVICTDIDECHSNIFLSPCIFYKCNNTDGAYECYGKPFFHQVSKMSTLGVLLLTISFLMYKEMYNLASLTCVLTSVLLILFAKNIL